MRKTTRRTAVAALAGAAARPAWPIRVGRAAPVARAAWEGSARRELLAWYYLHFSGDFGADLDGARDARIDGLIFSESGDRELAPYLDEAARRGQRLCLGLEPQLYAGPEELADRLRGIRALAEHPGYYWTWRTPDGLPRPVVVAFGVEPLGAAYWRTVRGAADPNHEMVWVGEGTTFDSAPFFDAWHLYSVAWANDPVGTAHTWAQRIRERGLRYAATVMPGGFYGTGTDPAKWTLRDRGAGAFYRATWAGAVAAGADLAILTSYNERAEQTDVQPLPEWGDLYLTLTAALADAWQAA